MESQPGAILLTPAPASQRGNKAGAVQSRQSEIAVAFLSITQSFSRFVFGSKSDGHIHCGMCEVFCQRTTFVPVSCKPFSRSLDVRLCLISYFVARGGDTGAVGSVDSGYMAGWAGNRRQRVSHLEYNHHRTCGFLVISIDAFLTIYLPSLHSSATIP